jgi:hypothetical protein
MLGTWTPAAAGPILTPATATTIEDASATNGAGASRTTDASGPLADSISHASAPNAARSAAAIDALGLHTGASVINDAGTGVTATARGIAGLVDPFMLVADPSFTGTHAMVEFHFHLTGSVEDGEDCPETCFSAIESRFSVDGLGDSFHYLGARSDGTKGSPSYIDGPVDKVGVLRGLLPVNTLLFLRGSLLTQTHCQSFVGALCATDVKADISFSGLSSDPVDFVWSLTPRDPHVPGVPEPASVALLGVGLLLVARRVRASGR